MIGMLRGAVWEKHGDRVVLDVAGTGYEVYVPTRVNAGLVLGAESVLHTCLIVREDDMSLYGFASARDKDLFRKLTSVSGIGPKAAMALLSSHDGMLLVQAIAQGNHALLTQAPGIGLKTAQRLILELKGKFEEGIWRDSLEGSEIQKGDPGEADGGTGAASGLDVLDSLVALGFSLAEARQAWKTVREREDAHGASGVSTEERVRAALRLLARGAS